MHKQNHALLAHKITVSKNKTSKPVFKKNYEYLLQINMTFAVPKPNHRAPETDSPNPWGSIEPSLRTTALESCRGMLAP